MTPLSSRYVVVLCVMMLASAVPVAAHYVVGMSNEDCENPFELKNLTINGATGVGEWPKHYNYAVDQYTRGEVRGARFVWVRSTVPQPFYSERPFYTPGRDSHEPSQLIRVRVDGVELPIRIWKQQDLSQTDITASLMIYRGQPVETVLAPSLKNAMETMFNGPRPVNFIGISGASHSSQTAQTQEQLVKWLAGAWTFYLRTCVEQ